MNYREFQKRNKKESEILPGEPKAFGKKHKEPRDYQKIWDFLSEASNPISLLAVISMIAFFRNHPEIPAIFCLITLICFYIRYKMGKCQFWLPGIWIFNTIIWSFNSITKFL